MTNEAYLGPGMTHWLQEDRTGGGGEVNEVMDSDIAPALCAKWCRASQMKFSLYAPCMLFKFGVAAIY
jgi:hypothetical protein